MNAHAYVSTPAARAVAAQLRQEIEDRGTSLVAVTERLGRHYETYRRYLASERALPVDDLLAILDVLGAEWGPFMQDARGRLSTRP